MKNTIIAMLCLCLFIVGVSNYSWKEAAIEATERALHAQAEAKENTLIAEECISLLMEILPPPGTEWDVGKKESQKKKGRFVPKLPSMWDQQVKNSKQF
jgi:hypothetical protein